MYRPGRRLASYWRFILHFCFLFLCARCVALTLYADRADIWPAAILVLTAGTLGWWRMGKSLFPFVISVLLVNGLAQAGFLNFSPALGLIFSSIFIGRAIRVVRICLKNAEDSVQGDSAVVFAADIFISAVLLSLVVQMWRFRGSLGFLMTAGEAAVDGFGSQHYFITSAFLWLQGLFFFRVLVLGNGSPHADELPVLTWVTPAFVAFGVTLVVFCAFQLVSRIPAPLSGYAYYLPCEDISSFGSIAASVFIFYCTQIKMDTWRRRVLGTLGIALFCAMIIASWSRATWLATALGLFAVLCIRAPRRWAVASVCLCASVILALNIYSERASGRLNPYSARLIALVQIENPAHKSPERMFLYHKAMDMIRVNSIFGGGIGSFYLKSVKYARPDDPNGSVPDFAHNAVLQIATELGVPLAILFAGLVALALARGFKAFSGPLGETTHARNVALGATLSLAVYSITQLTANSLNVYSTNQFIFWFLMAVLLSRFRYGPTEIADSSEPGVHYNN